jgi:hypothetical protein
MLTCKENRISEMELATDKTSQQFTFNLQTGSDNGCSNTKLASSGEMSTAKVLDSDRKILHTFV